MQKSKIEWTDSPVLIAKKLALCYNIAWRLAMKVIYIRVTEEEKRKLEEAAKKAHLQVTTWCRKVLLDKAELCQK